MSLVFANTIQTTRCRVPVVGDYGYLFVDPYTPAQNFEVGFSLDTAIVNDQQYVHLAPTEVFPDGTPIGVGYGLVQVQAASPVSSKFDLYGYVDVLHRSWLGAAAIFSFLNNDQYFPSGLNISQVFLRDSAGDPGVIATVFGPTVDISGHTTRAGGIAVLANFKQLLASGSLGRPGHPAFLRPEATLPRVEGRRAGEYRGKPAKLQT